MTSPTIGGRSVGIVRPRIQATEFVVVIIIIIIIIVVIIATPKFAWIRLR
jgi:hypothetical protein